LAQDTGKAVRGRSLDVLNQHAMPHQRPQLPAFLDGLACLHLSNDVVDQRRDCTLGRRAGAARPKPGMVDQPQPKLPVRP
ncbi:MAG: hypothetical protein WBY67_14315, partial [Pseudolabrys sp.]